VPRTNWQQRCLPGVSPIRQMSFDKALLLWPPSFDGGRSVWNQRWSQFVFGPTIKWRWSKHYGGKPPFLRQDFAISYTVCWLCKRYYFIESKRNDTIVPSHYDDRDSYQPALRGNILTVNRRKAQLLRRRRRSLQLPCGLFWIPQYTLLTQKERFE